MGVDLERAVTRPSLQPGVGLRPGGERPELEPAIEKSYRKLFAAAVLVHSAGWDVILDVGLHAEYASNLNAWNLAHESLAEAPTLWIGIACDPAENIRRRAASGYSVDPAIVARWDSAVHAGWAYDLRLDSTHTPSETLAETVLSRYRRKFGTDVRREGDSNP